MTIPTIASHIIKDETGATAVEYGLILAMVVLAMIGALGGTASETVKMWTSISEKSAAAHSGQ